jgi:hypothetical protein
VYGADTTSFTDYVTELWVEGHRFFWNHYKTEGPHTTNHLEGWDNKIKKKVHHAHPNIYLIIEVIYKKALLIQITKTQYLQYQSEITDFLVQVKEMGCYVYHVDESLLVPVYGVYEESSSCPPKHLPDHRGTTEYPGSYRMYHHPVRSRRCSPTKETQIQSDRHKFAKYAHFIAKYIKKHC